jgi:hypothetical protein
MDERIRPPAKNPCGSCPYRCDVPSGVWDESEYAKLPEFDLPTAEQPPSVFMCHQADGRLCAGWTACHDMGESLGLRMVSLSGQIQSVDDLDAILGYETSVPLFGSGAEAAAHGRAEIKSPGERALRTVEKLTQRKDRDE